MDATIKRLTPLINDPALQQKIDEAAGRSAASNDVNLKTGDEMAADEMMDDSKANKNMNEDAMPKRTRLQRKYMVNGSSETWRKLRLQLNPFL